MQQLLIYNTLSHQKELFKPITPDHVGMYVCGPTVYGDGHLGHARPAITFDVLYRYLRHIGYKVRYVRNITTWDIWSTMLTRARTRLPRRPASSSWNPWRWHSTTPTATMLQWMR